MTLRYPVTVTTAATATATYVTTAATVTSTTVSVTAAPVTSCTLIPTRCLLCGVMKGDITD